MSRKKGTAKPLDQLDQRASTASSQNGKQPDQTFLKKDIRKDVRTMYNKSNSVDKNSIYAKFIRTFPGNGDYISSVIENYSAALMQKGQKQQNTQNTTKKSDKKAEAPKNAEASKKQPAKNKPPTRAPAKSSALDNDELEHAAARESLVEEKRDDAIMQDFKDFLGANGNTNKAPTPKPVSSSMPSLDEQMQLLSLDSNEDWAKATGQSNDTLENAVLLSPAAEKLGLSMPSQFALLGHSHLSQATSDPRVMLNTNIPFSAFICGLQGSGKSHTTSCIIENCSLSMPYLGSLQKPLSTLVLHYNEYSSNVSSQPSETAFLSSVLPEYAAHSHQQSIPVTVLVPPSNFKNLAKMYSQIPNVQVRPFKLQPRHLNISMMLSLMSMNKGDNTPLYMAQVIKILREMAVESGGSFNYFQFRSRLRTLRLDKAQSPFLEQRLDLLDSYLDLKGEHTGDYFVDGGVTILDLSCPFMDQSTTCILFRVAIDLFLHAHPSRGKMVVADEAHKYMTDTPAAKELTETFLNIIRQQRHLGVRTIISTQEPTISPRLIDLCSITIIHRFSSPEWWRTIQHHVPVAKNSRKNKANYANGVDIDMSTDERDGLYQIASLRTGEALVFAPSAHLRDAEGVVADTKHGTFKMRVRKRITWDGGRTIMHVR